VEFLKLSRETKKARYVTAASAIANYYEPAMNI
jgi:hypothetical protein